MLPCIAGAASIYDHRIRLEFAYLCDYIPHNGVGHFQSGKCSDSNARDAATASDLRDEMDRFWHTEPGYAELEHANFESAFEKDHPAPPDPPPNTDELKNTEPPDLCGWWREGHLEAALEELSRRHAFTAKEIVMIRSQALLIGMSEKAMLCSIGPPEDINRTITSAGMHSQFAYSGRKFVYTENGIVTAIQY
jgi:hypothetical protein